MMALISSLITKGLLVSNLSTHLWTFPNTPLSKYGPIINCFCITEPTIFPSTSSTDLAFLIFYEILSLRGSNSS